MLIFEILRYFKQISKIKKNKIRVHQRGTAPDVQINRNRMDFLKAAIGYMYQYMMRTDQCKILANCPTAPPLRSTPLVLKHITRTSRRTTAIRGVIALRRRP